MQIIRHGFFDASPKLWAVIGVVQMTQLMHKHIFGAWIGVCGKMGGQPNARRFYIAAAPACAHLLDEYLVRRLTNDGLPCVL